MANTQSTPSMTGIARSRCCSSPVVGWTRVSKKALATSGDMSRPWVPARFYRPARTRTNVKRRGSARRFAFVGVPDNCLPGRGGRRAHLPLALPGRLEVALVLLVQLAHLDRVALGLPPRPTHGQQPDQDHEVP